MNRIPALATNLFPVWVLACGALALAHPAWFTWFSGGFITWGLAVIMLGMGITLTVDDFTRVLKTPRAVGIGFAAHYAIMPFLGWSIAHLLKLETPFAVGLILVSCCPSGTASNVVNYIARSNVALSVLITMCSTMGAIVMTPLLTKWLAGTICAGGRAGTIPEHAANRAGAGGHRRGAEPVCAALREIRPAGVAAGVGAGHHADLRQHHRRGRG
jgi:BASS family bile acid:Na+ symporter